MAFLVLEKKPGTVSVRIAVDFDLKTALNKGQADYALLAGITCSLRRIYHAYG